MNNKVAIGEVVSPSGFKGQFKIKSFTEKKDNFFKYGPVSIGSKFTGIKITKIKNAKDMFVVSCENIATKEAVEEIRGALIFVDREILPNLDSNKTFYFHDLINMNVYNENNNFLGKVISVDNYGSDDVIEIKDDKIRFSKRALEKDPLDWFKQNNKKVGDIITTRIHEVMKTGVKVSIDIVILSEPEYGLSARSFPATVTLNVSLSVPDHVDISRVYSQTEETTLELELDTVIVLFTTPSPIVIVGESNIDSEKVAVKVTVSEIPRRLSESVSVRVTVGVVVSMLNVILLFPEMVFPK